MSVFTVTKAGEEVQASDIGFVLVGSLVWATFLWFYDINNRFDLDSRTLSVALKWGINCLNSVIVDGSGQYNPPTLQQPICALATSCAPLVCGILLFMNYVQWCGMGPDILALAGGPTDPIEPVYAVVVGVVFKITKPVLDPDFGLDYDIDYDNFLGLQDKITKTPLRWFFLIKDRKTMRFNYPLWESKIDNNDTSQRDAIMAGYDINNCTPWFDLIKQSHQLCCLLLYNTNKNLDTKPKTWERKLVGTVVEMTFSLKHYHMATNFQCIEASDTFSTKVESLNPVLQSTDQSSMIPNFTLANGNILASTTVPVSSPADSVGTIMLTLTGPSSGSGENLVAGGSGLERAHTGTRTRRCGQDEEDHADTNGPGASPTKKSRQ
ncbi:hypothetical protein CVT25_004216 [Psilocybe cyanescens]|uniref:Uncharacterized protein n=1 Tax=Psilocybe cyanescens TaxID=93625 RepID=A0A409XW52_PSICY|nr:hypothetical protein CVT25_004216 [Psilocybe cyanescens]